ncbi:hypothetical protein [Algoriphagus boritolerans]
MEISAFDKSSAEQIKSYSPSDPIGTKILNTIYEIEENDRELLNEKNSKL